MSSSPASNSVSLPPQLVSSSGSSPPEQKKNKGDEEVQQDAPPMVSPKKNVLFLEDAVPPVISKTVEEESLGVQVEEEQEVLPKKNVLFLEDVELEEKEEEAPPSNSVSGSSFSYLIREEVRQELITLDVLTYFQSSEGGNRECPWIMTWIGRMADLIVWTYHATGLSISQYPGAFEWLKRIYSSEYISYLPRFLVYLEKNKTRKAGTRYAHVIGWIAASTWMLNIQLDAISISDMDIANRYFRLCGKNLRKSIRKENIMSKRTSIDDRIQNNTMPVDGLQSVQHAVLEEHPWCLQINHETVLDKEIFRLFIDVLVTSLYAFAPQGRIGGIESLSWRNGIDLVNDGVAMAEDFKTKHVYLYQPVIASPEVKPLLKLYLLYLLPWATKLPVPIDDKAPLFVTWNGEKDTNLSLAVRRFCKRKLNGILMGTTTIRAMVSTAAIEGVTDGLLNRRDQLAVHSVNGHSEHTARQSYHMRNRTQEAKDALNAFDVVCRLGSSSSSSTSLPQASFLETSSTSSTTPKVQALTSTTLSTISIPLPLQPNVSSPLMSQHHQDSTTNNSKTATLNVLDSAAWELLSNTPKQTMPAWGTQHPHNHLTANARASWTRQEVLTLGQLADRFLLQSNGGCKDKLMSTCLAYLRSPDGIDHRSIFHPRHIQDTTRLKCGYMTYQKFKAGQASLPTWEDHLDQPSRSRKRQQQQATTSSTTTTDNTQQPRKKRKSAPTTFPNEGNDDNDDNDDNDEDMVDLYVFSESDDEDN